MKLKLNLPLLFLLFFAFGYSQNNQKASTFEYVNFSSFSLSKNTESYFSKKSKEEFNRNDSFTLSINTIHGIKFFGIVALSTGISVDWNINKTFLSAPIIYDIRVFSNRNNGENVFLFLQTGQNIRWKNLTYGNGFSSKFGIGVILEPYDDVTFYVDIHKKSKEIELDNFTNLGFYRLNGFGISIGAIF